MQPFMALAVMLAGEGFAAYRTDEWKLVGVGAKVRAKVVGPRETLGTESALECRRMLLDTPVRAA